MYMWSKNEYRFLILLPDLVNPTVIHWNSELSLLPQEQWFSPSNYIVRELRMIGSILININLVVLYVSSFQNFLRTWVFSPKNLQFNPRPTIAQKRVLLINILFVHSLVLICKYSGTLLVPQPDILGQSVLFNAVFNIVFLYNIYHDWKGIRNISFIVESKLLQFTIKRL